MNLENLGDLDAQESGGVSAEAVEKLKEKAKKAQAAIKKIKQEESKVKKKDQQLGGIISGLIKSGSNSEILLLIVKLLAKRFTSSFIMGVLSLISSESKEAIEKKFQISTGGEAPADLPRLNTAAGTENTGSADKALEYTSKQSGSGQGGQESAGLASELPLHLKERLSTWVGDMWSVSSVKAPRTCSFLFSGDIIEPIAVQFVSFVIQDFLSKNNCQAQWGKVSVFSEQFLTNLGKKLKEKINQESLETSAY